jgi:hypothetical protein
MNPKDKLYIDWYNTIKEIDFNDNEYRKEIITDFTDDLTLLITSLLEDNFENDDELNKLIEDAIETVFKFGAVFLIKFEQYEQFEDAHLLHTILTEMLTLIYVYFEMFDGDYNDCNKHAKEQLTICINIIKEETLPTDEY